MVHWPRSRLALMTVTLGKCTRSSWQTLSMKNPQIPTVKFCSKKHLKKLLTVTLEVLTTLQKLFWFMEDISQEYQESRLQKSLQITWGWPWQNAVWTITLTQNWWRSSSTWQNKTSINRTWSILKRWKKHTKSYHKHERKKLWTIKGN